MATGPVSPAAAEPYKWTDQDTADFARWRAVHHRMFSGGRTTNAVGYKMFLEERGLVGRVTTHFLKKKWENLKQKYKDLKNPPTGLSTEGGEATAASWKWFDLMHELIGDRPFVTPPVLIATSAQGAVVLTPPSTTNPVRDDEVEEGEAAEHPAPLTTPKSRTSVVSRRRQMDAAEVLRDLQRKDELEWRKIQEEEREREEREERREAERARLAAEREEREDRRYRELMERQERLHQEAMAKEQRWREEMRARDEQRDREGAAREERFLAILERLANK